MTGGHAITVAAKRRRRRVEIIMTMERKAALLLSAWLLQSLGTGVRARISSSLFLGDYQVKDDDRKSRALDPPLLFLPLIQRPETRESTRQNHFNIPLVDIEFQQLLFTLCLEDLEGEKGYKLQVGEGQVTITLHRIIL